MVEKVGKLSETNAQAAKKLRESLQTNLTTLRNENSEKLELMRQTVDEKLQDTLEKRLGESFKLVSDRLEQVHKGLGEMQSLATGVGDLKRVLTNVKVRGTWGETQLSNLLAQVFSPEQYYVNRATRPGSNERVEFAIRLPGSDRDRAGEHSVRRCDRSSVDHQGRAGDVARLGRGEEHRHARNLLSLAEAADGKMIGALFESFLAPGRAHHFRVDRPGRDRVGRDAVIGKL